MGWQDNSNGNRGSDFQNHRYHSSPSNHMAVYSPSYCSESENSKQRSSLMMVFKNKREATCSSINSSASGKKTFNSMNSSKGKRKHL